MHVSNAAKSGRRTGVSKVVVAGTLLALVTLAALTGRRSAIADASAEASSLRMSTDQLRRDQVKSTIGAVLGSSDASRIVRFRGASLESSIEDESDSTEPRRRRSNKRGFLSRLKKRRGTRAGSSSDSTSSESSSEEEESDDSKGGPKSTIRRFIGKSLRRRPSTAQDSASVAAASIARASTSRVSSDSSDSPSSVAEEESADSPDGKSVGPSWGGYRGRRRRPFSKKRKSSPREEDELLALLKSDCCESESEDGECVRTQESLLREDDGQASELSLQCDEMDALLKSDGLKKGVRRRKPRKPRKPRSPRKPRKIRPRSVSPSKAKKPVPSVPRSVPRVSVGPATQKRTKTRKGTRTIKSGKRSKTASVMP